VLQETAGQQAGTAVQQHQLLFLQPPHRQQQQAQATATMPSLLQLLTRPAWQLCQMLLRNRLALYRPPVGKQQQQQQQ
jgi:hypothetical protein